MTLQFLIEKLTDISKKQSNAVGGYTNTPHDMVMFYSLFPQGTLMGIIAYPRIAHQS